MKKIVMVFIGRLPWKKLLFCVVLLSFMIGFYSGRACERWMSSHETVACELCDPNSLPSQVDVQRILNARGADPPLDVDGFIGKKSRKEWNEEVFNDYAEEAMKGTESNDKGTD